MEKILLADLTLSAHADAVVFLLNEYARDEMGGGTDLPEFVKQNLTAELMKRPQAHAILAFINNEPAGLAICFEGFSTFACKPLLNIHDVVVASSYRGRGLAKKMLAKAEDIAQHMGACKLTLEVLEGNASAQAAYKACGFAPYELAASAGKAMFWQKNLG